MISKLTFEQRRSRVCARCRRQIPLSRKAGAVNCTTTCGSWKDGEARMQEMLRRPRCSPRPEPLWKRALQARQAEVRS